MATLPEEDEEAIDAFALSVPYSVDVTVDSMAAKLCHPYLLELEKARSIFRWITRILHIRTKLNQNLILNLILTLTVTLTLI